MSSTRTTKKGKPAAIPNSTPSSRPGDPLPERIPNHPLAPLAGCFEDDPAWEELMEEVRKNRQREKDQYTHGGPLAEGIPDHPLAPAAGVFEDEPLWDDLMEEVRKFREDWDKQHP